MQTEVFVSNHIKSNDTGQDPDGCADEDVPWKVDAADDAHAGQRRAEDEQDDAQPRHDPEKGHGDDEDKASGEELIADDSFNLETEVLKQIDMTTLRKALKTLDEDEMELITALYLSKHPMSESKLARKLGVSQPMIYKRKIAIFEKIRKYF